MPLSRMRGFVAFVAFILFCDLSISAQVCPHGNINDSELIYRMEHSSDADVIYRAAAIAQDSLIPVLRRLFKPGMRVDSIPGAAQVSLVRLGDKGAMEQLEQELSETKLPYVAIDKLVRIGTDKAISALMTFLLTHLSDNSLYVDLGDASEDVRQYIISALAKHLQIGPLAQNGNFSVALQDWVAWWDHSKGRPIALSISNELQDPYLKCLARKVEWGFPNAILDLANSSDHHVSSILRKLTLIGDAGVASFSLGTVRGNAIVGLAKLGDEQAFKAIVHELDGIGYGGAIEELQLISGKNAVQALIDAFDSPTFMLEHLKRYRGTKSLAYYVRDRDEHILTSLGKMLANHPVTIGRESKKEWKKWWLSNKETAKFLPSVRGAYE